ncbi:hypothetical protein SLE2022_025660 [Rubroshorea leprosula]
MADTQFAPVFHSPPQRRSSSRFSSRRYTRFLCKCLFFVFFLVAIPLFPSEAPDFINQTIFTKFWELFHLLFIGIAVSYGLFGCRNVNMGSEIHSRDPDDSQSYVSRMFHVSSIFEDGYENSCGFDEKNVYKSWNSQHYQGGSVLGEQSKPGSFNVENGFENPGGYNEESVAQAWNSQYFQHESMVVVAQPNCTLDSGSILSHKPLGLPVRSLKSRVRNQDKPEIVNGSQSSPIGDYSFKSSEKSRNEKFDDMGPVNLREKFSETAGSSSPIPWRSRSVKTGLREKVSGTTRPSHFRPLSVDETQFEFLKSKSQRSSASSHSSQSSPVSHSPSTPSPSHSNSVESPNMAMGELVRERSYRRSFPPASPSLPTQVHGKASTNALHTRQYSCGPVLDNRASRLFEDDLKEFCGSKMDDSPDLDTKPAGPSKLLSRGKSVRTFRASGFRSEAKATGEKRESHSRKRAASRIDEVEAVHVDKSEPKTGGLDNLSPAGFSWQTLSGSPHMPKTTSSGYQNMDKQECCENTASALESGEDSESVDENIEVMSNEEAASENAGDVRNEVFEVDKKAGEFIAKFREQIRLQKSPSIDTPRGINFSSNLFR